MLAPPAAAATLATAVAVHGSGADKTLDHAAVATASPQSFPAAAADAGTPQTQGLPAAAVAAPPSPCSDSYSYYSSYSEDVEPAPAAAGASTRTWPAVQKKICKRSTATAVHGQAPRPANFMRRVMHARRRPAGKAVTTASISAGAAAVAASAGHGGCIARCSGTPCSCEPMSAGDAATETQDCTEDCGRGRAETEACAEECARACGCGRRTERSGQTRADRL
jgi:hypothetical protein